MKTTGVTIKGDAGWQKLETLLGITFEQGKTYTMQVQCGGSVRIALDTDVPDGAYYLVLTGGRDLVWTYDGDNTMFVSPGAYSDVTLAIS